MMRRDAMQLRRGLREEPCLPCRVDDWSCNSMLGIVRCFQRHSQQLIVRGSASQERLGQDLKSAVAPSPHIIVYGKENQNSQWDKLRSKLQVMQLISLHDLPLSKRQACKHELEETEQ
eukprot:gb/GFBE01061793.1/.p1 GENE.gb/GFBE01061793.1/~~gb/GFBE01061793.1/.p1  ORF type:complete len:118 (+),score=21.26 gb/GFBE01061793.1/:1-354(+)